jgi:cyclic lactone autoinducer peptide
MKKNTLMVLVAFVASALTFAATTTSASACFWGFYQPEEPEMLRKNA